MNKLLEIKNLSKSYNTKNGEVQAIDKIDLDVYKGDFIAVVGSSGCGKSTLLNIIAGLDKDYEGTCKLKKNTKTSYMFQTDCLFNWRTIYDNCKIGLEITNNDNTTNLEKINNLLNFYNLNDFKNKKPNNLSGGMKQRVALIRTLATDPDILLLDEPFSALDYQTRLAISNDVYISIKKENKTAIMVTHDIAEAISMANKIVVLSQRPCRIKKIYEINLENTSTPIENRKAKEFSILYDSIWKDLDINV